MKTIGIIAEYNPFHSGHLYQIRQVREQFHADFVVIAMSGDFVQRGEPAVYDKYLRTQIALDAGADLILELPVSFATSSAEDFAHAGVALLDCLGVTDGLCFGSELGKLAPIETAARLLVSEPESYQKLLQDFLRSGNSFPKARALALSHCLTCADGLSSFGETELEACLSSPNNILGVEYVKALIRRKSQMKPLTIKRTGQGYHDSSLTADSKYPSASALRQAIQNGQIDYFQSFARSAQASCQPPIFADDLSLIFNWRLLEVLNAGQPLSDFADLSPELAARLSRKALDFETFSGRIRQMKTRQYTYTRISRALLHLLLGITDADIRLAKELNYVPYVRVLGFRQSASPLLSRIKRSCPLPLITKTADAREILQDSSLRLFQKDIHASHLYQTLVYNKNRQPGPNEYTRSVIIRPG